MKRHARILPVIVMLGACAGNQTPPPVVEASHFPGVQTPSTQNGGHHIYSGQARPPQTRPSSPAQANPAQTNPTRPTAQFKPAISVCEPAKGDVSFKDARGSGKMFGNMRFSIIRTTDNAIIFSGRTNANGEAHWEGGCIGDEILIRQDGYN